MELAKFSLGVGDRFAQQAKAQLHACQMAAERGVEVIPVWNKSHREHTIVGSEPSSVRRSADAAVHDLGWKLPYHVDADHIRLETVDGYLASSDFFTIDVADSIVRGAPPALGVGGQAPPASVAGGAGPSDMGVAGDFVARHPELVGRLHVPGIEEPFETTANDIARIAGKYLAATREAGRIYRRVAGAKGEGTFITEVSMDETDNPQTPPELLVILAALADERIPLQTIAPKFTGRFNKGVDYVGDVTQFEKEFRDDIAVIAYAVRQYRLPASLKLSVHSGSDKFSIYGPIRRSLAFYHAGVHLKTAGTTWLEELIGLAEAGGEGLALVKEIYAKALEMRQALCEPYAAVIDIDPARLPSLEEVARWSSEQLAAAVRHDQSNPAFNPNVRQLLHVGYKIAAQMGERYLELLDACETTIARNVTANLYDRHIRPVFLG